MRGESQGQFLGRDAAAVVDDADQLAAAVFNLDDDVGGPGIEGVFDQFLDHRSGALDHLAGGDAVDQERGKLADGLSGHVEQYKGGGAGGE
jgi:hypothetical protein